MKKTQHKYEKVLRIGSHLMNLEGFRGTSLQEIADKVGIHKSTFFHYFKNKEELLLSVLNIAVDEPLSNLKRIYDNKDFSPTEKLRLAITDHLYFAVKYYDNVNVYHSEIKHLSRKNKKKYIALRKNYASYFERIINDIKKVENGYFNGLDSKIVSFGILGMCNWVSQWFKKKGPLKIEDISNAFFRMIIPDQP